MNIHTFKDVVTSKRSSLAHDLDDDDEEDDGEKVSRLRSEVEGEEDEGEEQFNEAGEAIMPFNMRDERDGGHIDENMNYVFQRDRGEIDTWVADLDEVAMERAIGEAAAAKRKRDAEMARDASSFDAVSKKTPLELKHELLQILIPGETIAAAMRRLSGREASKASNSGITKRRRPSEKSAVVYNPAVKGGTTSTKPTTAANRALINRLTEIADELMSSTSSSTLSAESLGGNGVGGGGTGGEGMTAGVYDMAYEAIWASTVLWEYQALDGSGAVHGPYTSQQIAAWKAQGFMTGPTAVLIRQAQYQPTASSGSSSFSGDSDEGRAAPSTGATSGSKRGFSEDKEPDSSISGQQAPSTKKLRTEEGSAVALQEEQQQQQPPPPQSVAEAAWALRYADWVSSDDIDFGQYSSIAAEERLVHAAGGYTEKSAVANARERHEKAKVDEEARVEDEEEIEEESLSREKDRRVGRGDQNVDENLALLTKSSAMHGKKAVKFAASGGSSVESSSTQPKAGSIFSSGVTDILGSRTPAADDAVQGNSRRGSYSIGAAGGVAALGRVAKQELDEDIYGDD